MLWCVLWQADPLIAMHLDYTQCALVYHKLFTYDVPGGAR